MCFRLIGRCGRCVSDGDLDKQNDIAGFHWGMLGYIILFCKCSDPLNDAHGRYTIKMKGEY